MCHTSMYLKDLNPLSIQQCLNTKVHDPSKTYYFILGYKYNHSFDTKTLSNLLFVVSLVLYHINFLPIIGMSNIYLFSVKELNFLYFLSI